MPLRNAVQRMKLDRLEAEMLQFPQEECSVVHSFSHGLYIRQVTLKAGTYAIGHFQKTTHLNVMLCGHATMIEADGSYVERRAPLIYVADPGRKVGYIHEDVVWLNIYATTETDVDVLEAALLEKSAYFKNSLKPLASKDDRADFTAMLIELGVTAELVRSQSENTSDQIAFPPGCYGVKIGASAIEGRGLIATRAFAAGEQIVPARVGLLRTPAGRYTNHAKVPNAKMVLGADGSIVLVALRDICGCRGGLDGEEVTVDYRQARNEVGGLICQQ